MTIVFGAWVLPAAITLLGWIPCAFRRGGDWDFIGAALWAAWMLASVVSWVVYAFTLAAS